MALSAFALFATAACTEVDPEVETSSGIPTIERVSVAEKDSTVTEGRRQNTYIIYGENLGSTQAIYFNEVEAYFNPTLVTEDNIIVRVPEDAPYFDASNELVIETANGVATMPFSIAQPAPIITGFSPLAAGAGDTITIRGEIFEGLEAVRFDEVEAEIVSSTDTEIQVEVPEGIVQAYIFVETLGGVTQSTQQFGFKNLIYGDELAAGWWEGGWSGTATLQSDEQVKRGTFAIKEVFNGGYAGFQVGNGGAAIHLADYQAIKMSIYSESATRVRLAINGMQNNDAGIVLELEEGWNDFTVPFSQIFEVSGTAFETLDSIVIQEFAGAASTIYIDDLGLI